jgi:uncharacterized protein (DUF58 family)
MFVPSKRLLWLVALGLTPMGLGLGMMGVSLEIIGLAALALLLLAGLDAAMSLHRLRGVTVSLPPILRASKGKRLALPLEVSDSAKQCSELHIGLPFPMELESESGELIVKLLPDKAVTPANWEVLAIERGGYSMDTAYLQTSSYLGFWDMRGKTPCQTEVRVYPDLSRDKHVLAPLFFRRGGMGTHRVRQLGRGREFEQLRGYLPGDSYSDIYWKGTARRNYPITQMYQVERTQEVHVIVDISRRSARPLDNTTATTEQDRFAPKTQCERYIQAALVLALAAQQQGDRFGLMTFSDQVHTIVPAKRGQGHYNTVRDALYLLEPRSVSPDFAELFIQIGNRIRQRSLVIILTDLAEPWLSESFQEAVGRTARKHVVLVHMLGSKEFQPLFKKGDSISTATELYSKLAGHLLWSDLADTTRELKQLGLHLTTSLEENLIAEAVSGYLTVKKRQLV